MAEMLVFLPSIQIKPLEHRWIEVSEDLFLFLTQGQKTPYLWYGNPGVRIYPPGVREAIEKEESKKCP